jgi:hypothetical protein
MSIHMIATYVPAGTVVRLRRYRLTYEGPYQPATRQILTPRGPIGVRSSTLLEVVRFPGEEAAISVQPSALSHQLKADT